MRIIAADSGGAILGEDLEPTHVVCTVAVLVEPPYRTPTALLAEPSFCPMGKSYSLLVKELELCSRLLEQYEADVIHFDMTLRRIRLDQLSLSDIAHLPERARKELTKVVPKLTFLASKLLADKGVPAIAIGKDSLAIRIAELCCAAHSVLFSAEKALEENREVLLGLPVNCEVHMAKGMVIARSLSPSENDIMGYAEDPKGILGSIQMTEMPNPTLRNFKMMVVRPLRA